MITLEKEMFEKVSPGKVTERIKQDGKDEGRKAIERVVKTLTDRGFDAKEVAPLVRQGVREACYE
jgi:hypothetical protein